MAFSVVAGRVGCTRQAREAHATRVPPQHVGAAQPYFDSFNKRLRARSSVRRSLGVRLPMPDLAILSRIGSTASEMSSSSRRVGTDLGRTLNFGLGCNRALKFSHQINSGPTPRRRTKQNPAAILVHRTTRSVQE